MKKFVIFVALVLGLNADSFTHIRNATAKITYGEATFLLDPYLAKKGAYEGFAGTLNSHLRNPLTELPMDVKEILQGVDAVIITHTHDDHFDEAAAKILPKEIKIFTQHQADKAKLESFGFKNVEIINESVDFKGVTLYKTGGAHGTIQMYAHPQLSALLGDAMGMVFSKIGHKTLYVAGDTIWTADVNKAINKFQPELIVLNTGYAKLDGFDGSIIMGKDDVKRAASMTKAKIIAVHMEAVNHATLSRKELRDFVKSEGIETQVIVPNDGESIKF